MHIGARLRIRRYLVVVLLHRPLEIPLNVFRQPEIDDGPFDFIDNITQRELGIYQSLASTLVVLSNDQIETALKANELMEVQHEPND